MVVLEEGVVAKYDIHGNFLKQSSLPNVSMYVLVEKFLYVSRSSVS